MKFLVLTLLVAAVAAEEAARPERSAVWGVPSVVGVAPGLVGVPSVVGVPRVVAPVVSPLGAHVRLVRSAEDAPRPERSAVWGSVVGVPTVVGAPGLVGVPSVIGVPRLVGPGLIAPGLVGVHG